MKGGALSVKGGEPSLSGGALSIKGGELPGSRARKRGRSSELEERSAS